MPCPIDVPLDEKVKNIPNSEANRTIMTSSKNLRSFLKLNEEKTCDNCLFAKICSLKNKEPTNEKANKADLSDVFNVLAGLYI